MKLDLGSIPPATRQRALRPEALERRAFGREREFGSAMAAFYDEQGAICLTRVDLSDSSATGIGVRSPMPIEPGARVCLYSNDVARAHGPHLSATVVRCERDVRPGEGSDEDESEFCLGLRRDRPWLPRAA